MWDYSAKVSVSTTVDVDSGTSKEAKLSMLYLEYFRCVILHSVSLSFVSQKATNSSLNSSLFFLTRAESELLDLSHLSIHLYTQLRQAVVIAWLGHLVGPQSSSQYTSTGREVIYWLNYFQLRQNGWWSASFHLVYVGTFSDLLCHWPCNQQTS